jgi:predicted cobalt transporter CbtA
MVRTFFVRGLLAGLVAGLAAGVFAFFVGEPYIASAIAIEEAAAHAAGATHEHAEELVSRGGQRFGLFLAAALYGVALGGLFGLAFAALRGRIGSRSDSVLAAGLSGAAFVAVVVVPFLKYPANPPAVGNPDTIGQRTTLYLVAVAIGLLAVAASALAHRKFTGPAAWPAAGAAFVLPVAAAWMTLPTMDEVQAGFPATLLWNFRVASFGTQAVFWFALGAAYAYAAHRENRPVQARAVAV